MLGTLSPADKAAIVDWQSDREGRRSGLQAAGAAAFVTLMIAVGLLGGGTGAGFTEEIPGSLRRQIRRLRRGRSVTALLWYRQDAGGLTGPAALEVRNDFSCRVTVSRAVFDLRDAELASLKPYSGPSPSRFEPIPSSAYSARLRTAQGLEIELVGDRSNLAVLGVLFRWPGPDGPAQ